MAGGTENTGADRGRAGGEGATLIDSLNNDNRHNLTNKIITYSTSVTLTMTTTIT